MFTEAILFSGLFKGLENLLYSNESHTWKCSEKNCLLNKLLIDFDCAFIWIVFTFWEEILDELMDRTKRDI